MRVNNLAAGALITFASQLAAASTGGVPSYAELLAAIADSRDTAVDMNGDGVPDVIRTFAADGSVASIRVDHDFDGNADIEAVRANGTLSVSEDRDRDGRFDHREIRPSDPGAPYSRIEWRDENGDGFEEAWAFERLDPTGRLIVREESLDTDRDGTFDRRWTTTRPRLLAEDPSDALDGGMSVDPDLAGGVCVDHTAELEAAGAAIAQQLDIISRLNAQARSGGGSTPAAPPLVQLRFGIQMGPSCNTPILAGPMRREIERSVTEGFKCLAVNNPALMVRFLVFLITQRPEVHCLDPSGFPAKAAELMEREPPDHDHEREPDRDPEDPNEPGANPPTVVGSDASQLCGLGEVNGRVSWISTQAFNPTRGCIPVAGVVLHEFMHNMGVGTSARHLPTDLHDGVYGCQRTCFPHPLRPANASQIAACQAAH